MPKETPIQRLINHVLNVNYLDEVSKQVILERLHTPPTADELRRAQARAMKGHNASQ